MTVVDQDMLAARLRNIVEDPSWPGWYRAEAKSWGAEGLEPTSLADDDMREALRARMLARPKPGGAPMTREALDEWLDKHQAADERRAAG